MPIIVRPAGSRIDRTTARTLRMSVLGARASSPATGRIDRIAARTLRMPVLGARASSPATGRIDRITARTLRMELDPPVPAEPGATGRMLTLDAAGDWFEDARRVPSPNCDARPPGCDIDLIVVHGISLPPGEFGGPYVEQLFCNRLDADAHDHFPSIASLRVSAHLLIRRDGSLVQFVALSERAWHAGASCFEGRTRCNDFSIGIELEGTDCTPYETAQYERLGGVCRALMHRWPAIAANRIVGHSDVAPRRKTDPGPAFDWQRLKALVTAR